MGNILLFDGECNLCNASVQFILRWEKSHDIRFASLQSEFGQNILDKYNYDKEDFTTLLYLKDNQLLVKSDAALEISRQLKAPVNWFYIFKAIPKKFRDSIYMAISRNRKRFFSGKSLCLMPTEETKNRFIK